MASYGKSRSSKRPAKGGKKGGFLEMAQEKAGGFMKSMNKKFGGGARKRRLDEVIEEQTTGKKRPRK